MNKAKTSNLLRLIAFFLTGAILICTFGFTVDGWMMEPDIEDSKANNTIYPDDKNELQTPDDESAAAPEEPEIYIPQFTNRLTGLETTEELSNANPIAFIMDSKSALYGISNADIVAEIPTEDGNTRLLCITSNTQSLWKVGSIAKTRAYISNIAQFFDAAIVCNGCDDKRFYESCDLKDNTLDLSVSKGYHYTEFSDLIYTNVDLVLKGFEALGNSLDHSNDYALPYRFNNFGNDNVLGNKNAKSIKLTYSQNNITEFIFSEETRKYTSYKNGSEIVDSLNEKAPQYTNCLVLFADSITYETSDYNQMIMSTIGNGSGLYFTEGTVMEIKWTATTAGILSLYTSKGDKLTINRGNTFISYMKSSRGDNLLYS